MLESLLEKCWEAEKKSEGLGCSISLGSLLVLPGHLCLCIPTVLQTLLVATY